LAEKICSQALLPDADESYLPAAMSFFIERFRVGNFLGREPKVAAARQPLAE
jgi:hypothetical protein